MVPKWAVVLTGFALPVGVLLLSWWTAELAGFYDTGTDYDTRPASPWSPLRLGSLALGVLLLGTAVPVWARATRARQLRVDWWSIQGLAWFAALIVGGTWSMARADTVDANIGGGLAVLFGLPLAGVLLVVAGVWSLLLLRRRRAR